MISFKVNGTLRDVDVVPSTPLLWVLRDTAKLKGTKYGCGAGLCGACTVHMDGIAIRSCTMSIGSVGAAEITTIEGLANHGQLHPVQMAWIEEDVPQCGYCQAGQIMQAVSLLRELPNPTDEQIETAMSGNLCRCGTYPRIKRAIRRVADTS